MTSTHRQFTSTAMTAAQNRAMCMSTSFSSTTMRSTNAATTSIRIKEIGVTTPVSLFVLVLVALPLSLLQVSGLISLVSLITLISLASLLTIISLTGLGVLVGLTGLAPGEPGGD